MEISLTPVEKDEFDIVFAVVKQGIYPHVEAVFGWSDEFQRTRLKNDYESAWFHWIIAQGKRVGLLCFKPYDNAIHVHLLIIFPEYRNQKLGTSAMVFVHELAAQQARSHVTLSSFKRNERAISFYRTLGYDVIDNDDSFVSLSWGVSS